MGIIPLLPRLLYLASFILLLTAGCGRREKAPPPPENEAAQEEKPSGWQVLGPGGGGAQYWPTINPADPDHIFICCDMTGVFVTENGGESWRMFNLHGAVKDFEFDPQNPNTVYAADNGLYRSDDRGKVWRLIYPEPATVVAQRMLGDEADHHFETAGGVRNIIIDKVRVDPVNNSRVYSGFHEKGNPMASLLVSNDRGESWKLLANSKGSKVLAIFPGSWNGKPDEVTLVTDQSMARVTESTGDIVPQQMPCAKVYFADGGKGAQGGVFYLMASMEAKDGKVSGGVFRTDDGGKSWKQINKGLLDGWAVTGKLPLFKSFGVCEQYPRVVYLSAYSYYARFNGDVQRQFGILKTENSGNSWHWCYRANDDSVLTNNFYGAWLDRNYEQAPGRREYPLCLGVSPVHPDICYATDMGRTYRSLDGGKRWDQVYSNDHPDGSSSSRGIDVTTCYGVHFDPFDKNHIFISYTDIGAFHSFNGGRSWYQAITGIPHHWRNTCYWLEFDPAVKGRIWAAWSNTHDLPRSKMYRSGALAGGRQQGGVSVSTDGGRQWELCSGGMLKNGQYKGGLPANAVCTFILIDPESPVDSRTLYVCEYGRGVYKSTDAGSTWQLKAEGLGDNRNAWRMVRLPSGKLFLLVARGKKKHTGYVDGALYTSVDRAGTWHELPLPQGVNAPNDLVYDPEDPERMYLCCWPWMKDGRELCGGLLRTEDGGESWKRVFNEQAHVYAAAVDKDNPATVFINTFEKGAYRSDDRGENWYRLAGYNFKWGHRPVPDPHNPGMLYLTTFGGSLFYGPAEGVPGAAEDIENLPPFNW